MDFLVQKGDDLRCHRILCLHDASGILIEFVSVICS